MFEKEAEKHKENFVSFALNLGVNLNTAENIGAQKEESFREDAELGYDKALEQCAEKFAESNRKWQKVLDEANMESEKERSISLKRLYQIREACQIIGNLMFDLENNTYPNNDDILRAEQFLSKNKEM